MAVKKLTDEAVEAATGDPRKAQTFTWDAGAAGLGLRVSRKGKRSWVYRYYGGERDRRLTLGEVALPGAADPTRGRYDLAAARAKAAELSALVDRGEDPAAPALALNGRPTLFDLWKRFEGEHLPKRSEGHRRNLKDAFERLILPKLGAVAVEDLDWSAVDAWHQGLAGTPTQGNRALAALRKALNLARRWGWLPPGAGNAATDHDAHPERKAGRPFTVAEYKALGKALEAEPGGVPRTALTSYLLSPLRPGELVALRWEDFEGDGLVRLPASKTGERVAVLPTRAENVARELPAAGPYVFPGRTEGAHLHSLSGVWKRVRAAAGMGAGRRLYDGRHSWISIAAGLGLGDDVRRVLAGHVGGGGSAHAAYLHASAELRSDADRVAEVIAKRLGVGWCPYSVLVACAPLKPL